MFSETLGVLIRANTYVLVSFMLSPIYNSVNVVIYVRLEENDQS